MSIEEKVCKSYQGTESLKRTAKECGISLFKVRRILVVNGLYNNQVSELIEEYFDQGMSKAEVAKKIGVKEKTLDGYLPYSKGIYGDNPTKNALSIRKCRKKAETNPERKIPWRQFKKFNFEGIGQPIGEIAKGFDAFDGCDGIWRGKFFITNIYNRIEKSFVVIKSDKTRRKIYAKQKEENND